MKTKEPNKPQNVPPNNKIKNNIPQAPKRPVIKPRGRG